MKWSENKTQSKTERGMHANTEEHLPCKLVELQTNTTSDNAHIHITIRSKLIHTIILLYEKRPVEEADDGLLETYLKEFLQLNTPIDHKT